MVNINYVKFITTLILIAFGWVILQNYIKNQVVIQVTAEKENSAKILSDKIIELENNRIKIEKKLKDDIIESKSALDKCNLQIEEIKKQKELKELSKKNPKQFKKEIDKILGTKGKTK